jgi:hypothetical protein
LRLFSQLTSQQGRKKELKSNIESSLPKLDLLKKRIQERDSLASDCENCRISLKTATDKQMNIDQVNFHSQNFLNFLVPIKIHRNFIEI